MLRNFANKLRERSLARRLNILFLILGITVTAAFFTLFMAQRQALREYESFVRINSQLSELPFFLYESSRLYSSLQVEYSKELVNELYHAFEQIDRILALMESEINRNDVLVFKRTLSTMFSNWRLIAIASTEAPIEPGPETFATGTYMRDLSAAMDRQARLLVVSYLSASSERNHEVLLRTQNLSLRLMIISCLLALATLWGSRMITNTIVVDIKRLAASSEDVSLGNLEGRPLKPSTFHELNSVISAFNRMRQSIRDHIDDLKKSAQLERELDRERLTSLEKDRLLRETQLHALHMQINPHFLFNALNMVSRMALRNDNEAIIEFVSAMSRIMRFNLENESGLVSLKDEFSVLRAYVYIQEARFGDRIEFMIAPEEKIPEGRCPPMILQPLVENAITHGLQNCEAGGRVFVDVRSGETTLEIRIEDNGSGCAEDILRSAISGERESESSRKSLGLHNVARRLELYFGDTSLLEGENLIGGGLRITLQLPHAGEAVT